MDGKECSVTEHDYLCSMFNLDDAYRVAGQRFSQGSAVVDLKFNEVFRFTFECDAKVVFEWPGMFRNATPEESEKLRQSGESSIQL